jgi:amino acid adenylation domain-containing protein
LIKRHAMLRVSIRLEDGKPVNVVDPAPVPDITYERINADSESGIDALLTESARIPFDLEKGPLVRVHVFSRSDREQYLLITLHHIIFDGKSLPLLLGDLIHFYGSVNSGEPVETPPPGASYADFVRWQLDMLQEPLGRNHGSYWHRRLSGGIPVLDLPYDRLLGRTDHPRGEHHRESISGQMMTQLEKTAKQHGVSLFTLLLSTFVVLLHRYSQLEPDIVVGTPVSGRSKPVFDSVMGHFANMTPIRVRLSGGTPFPVFLQQTQKAVLEAVEHGDYPFMDMVQGLGSTDTPVRSRLFQTAFVYLDWLDQHTAGDREAGDGAHHGLSLERLPSIQQEEEFEITFKIYQRRENSLLVINYDANLFSLDTIKRLTGHYRALLDSIIASPMQEIREMAMLPPEERHCLIKDFTATDTPYPRRKTLHQLFEEQVRKSPDKIALCCDARSISYAELNTRANQLANYLRQKKVRPETLVGVCMQRSIGMVTAILAIIKTGGAYVPMDPDYPPARIATLLADAGIELLITQSDLLAGLPDIDGLDLFCWDNPPEDMNRFSSGNIDHGTANDNIVYLMYTSGSTGTPKGVAVTHQGVVRLVKTTNYIDFNPEDRILQFAPLSFDASTFEIWGALLNGCELYIYPGDKTALPELADFIHQNRISIVWLTSGLFRLFVDHYLDAFNGVRILLAGGDTLSPPHVKKFNATYPDCRLINGYGPTENTTFTTTFPIAPEETHGPSVPIGKPIANTRIYIADAYGSLVPPGIAGEILIGGAGLARGYWRNPDLTAERFIPDGFGNIPGQRLYRTGDIGRWLPDGNIEFLGRMDEQIKLRGFRVELGEIEAAISGYPGLNDVVVTLREDTAGDKRLAAYFTTQKDAAAQSLRAHLQDILPTYMIPSYFLKLDSLPLTPNGKIDRTALPPPENSMTSGMASVPPQTELENRIVEIWKDVLGIERVGTNDNLFDAGGNSLLIVEVYNRLLKEPLEKKPKMVDLFQYPTIKSLSQYLGSAATTPTKKQDPKASSGSSNRRTRLGLIKRRNR